MLCYYHTTCPMYSLRHSRNKKCVTADTRESGHFYTMQEFSWVTETTSIVEWMIGAFTSHSPLLNNLTLSGPHFYYFGVSCLWNANYQCVLYSRRVQLTILLTFTSNPVRLWSIQVSRTFGEIYVLFNPKQTRTSRWRCQCYFKGWEHTSSGKEYFSQGRR